MNSDDIDWAALKARAPRGPAPTPEDIATLGDGVYLPAGTPVAERRAALADYLARRAPRSRERGPQKAPVKEQATLRFPAGALDRWRATGPGWQARLGDWVAQGPAT